MSQDHIAFLITNALIILMKVVCFTIGYLIVKLGYQLVSSGVKGEFKFSAQLGGATADLRSVSPGLLFVFLGASVIGYAVYVDKGTTLDKKVHDTGSRSVPTFAIPGEDLPGVLEKEVKQ